MVFRELIFQVQLLVEALAKERKMKKIVIVTKFSDPDAVVDGILTLLVDLLVRDTAQGMGMLSYPGRWEETKVYERAIERLEEAFPGHKFKIE